MEFFIKTEKPLTNKYILLLNTAKTINSFFSPIV